MRPHLNLESLAVALLVSGWGGAGLAESAPTPPAPGADLIWVQGPALSCGLNRSTGFCQRFETGLGPGRRSWVLSGATLQVRNEASNRVEAEAPARKVWKKGPEVSCQAVLAALGLTVVHHWRPFSSGLEWTLTFSGQGLRVGHEVVLELPILSPAWELFTPSEMGVMSLNAYPTFKPVPYGAEGWESGRAYVLPLLSVFDEQADQALTVAVPPDGPMPQLQFEWRDSKVLRLSLAHLGLGGGKPWSLRLRFYAHPADYRSVLKAYAEDFPRYFKPGLPRGPFEGTFYYHHIQAHPDFAEMRRQSVRFIWSSFWFTHLGEYLPEETEWAPYTYAKGWKLGQTMTDEKIRSFIDTLHGHGLGTYAYFNVTEYGGYGGQSGDAGTANRRLREQFANALILNEKGQPIPTWEGAMAMNPRHDCSLWPFLEEQLRRHLRRLPQLDGFVIDRLDWASTFDYGHDDGFTMIGDRPVEDMAKPVAEAVQAVCKIAHRANKRVFVNQFYRIEVLRDVDGYCHENDFLPALGYLSPYRPASAWHMRKPYKGDLVQFEAQLKRRLQFALFPQMIAHEFPISQQAPDPRTADLLELYAPLFDQLIGKQQVLRPHCVEVTGPNEANLFVNGRGDYVVPVTSRVSFLTRGTSNPRLTEVVLHLPDAAQLKWAHVYSADLWPYKAVPFRRGEAALVGLTAHGSASVVVVGKGKEPPLADGEASRLERLREKTFPVREFSGAMLAASPAPAKLTNAVLRISGIQLGQRGRLSVYLGKQRVGTLTNAAAAFALDNAQPGIAAPSLRVELVAGDQGTWFLPEHVEVVSRFDDGDNHRVARWAPTAGPGTEPISPNLHLSLRWCRPERLEGASP